MKNAYELQPMDGCKSFYGKAIVVIDDDNTRHLFSYGTLIMSRNPDGTYTRHWDGWSATTGRHITAFCGMHKKEFKALDLQMV